METIRVEVIVHSNLATVWEMFTNPKHVMKWNYASNDWECPYAKNDLKVGGRFVYRMTAKDKSASFNFTGTYKTVVLGKTISYILDDRRKVSVTFETTKENEIKLIEIFEAERVNPIDMQRTGWYAILTNFKEYVETNTTTQTEKKPTSTNDTWVG